MLAIGSLAQAAIGYGVWADGLACTPTATPSLSVVMGPGSIGQVQSVDAGGFGSLPPDTNPVMKIGFAETSTQITLAAPSVAGQSINYLIQGQLQETDGNPVALPYYNASNPSVPYTGPGGSGAAQNTTRIQRPQLSVKAGASAATGSQNTPGADAGWAPLWIVTVDYGQVAITGTHIYQAPQAPFLLGKVGQQRQKLIAPQTLYVSPTGSDTANNGYSLNTAFASIQAAINSAIQNYDTNGFPITISVASGTYSGFTVAGKLTGGGSLFLIAPNGATISSTNGTPCVFVKAAGIDSISGFTYAASGSAGLLGTSNGLLATNGYINHTNSTFSACAGPQIVANGAGVITSNGTVVVSGNAPAIAFGLNGGLIAHLGGTFITLTGNPAFSEAIMVADLLGIIDIVGFSGAATGKSYEVSRNSVVEMITTALPGTIAGTTASGGIYA